MISLLPSRTPSPAQIKNGAAALDNCDPAELRRLSMELRFRAQSGVAPPRLIEEGFALVVAATKHVLGLELYDAQIEGGIQLALERIIQMETGQGKTLTATAPLFLYSLYGEGSHLLTANDYLAYRDAKLVTPILAALGVRVGAVQDNSTDQQRRSAYACDVTYATASQVGFDLLRDRLKTSNHQPSLESDLDNQIVAPRQRFVIADEADALLIDEANIPLIIGASGRPLDETTHNLFHWANGIAEQAICDVHYEFDLASHSVNLRPAGHDWVRQHAYVLAETASMLALFQLVELAILAHKALQRDKHYLVRDGEIVIVTEATGRLGKGRQWQRGIQQALQAKEGLVLSASNTHAGRLLIQSLIQSYESVAGMTGTAIAARQEFQKVYKRRVCPISRTGPSRRKQLRTRAFRTMQRKLQAIVAEIRQLQASGRPVLVSTRSVGKSEQLSQLLAQHSITHQVLNAKHDASEAEIIECAGKTNMVTIATNMAGRGTDIQLSREACEAGGLHVVLTELHDSPRQDLQMIGRAARLDQPGSYRVFLSLDDEILASAYGPKRARRFQRSFIPSIEATLRSAQRVLQRRLHGNRMLLLHYEQRRLQSIWQMGRDPLLDAM